MFFLLSKILGFVISPLTWVILFALIGLLSKENNRRIKFLKTSFLLLVLFTNPWLINQLTRAWEIQPYSQKKILKPYDAGLLMGGSLKFYNSETNRIVYSSSVDRLLQTIDLYFSHKIKKIIISGGSGFVNFKNIKEASLLRTTLINMHIPDSDIVIENKSRNTYENALYSAQLIRQKFRGKTVLIITSAIHIRRTQACFEKQNINAGYFPADERSGTGIYTPDKLIIPNIDCMQAWEALIHEWVGMLMYKLKGYA